MPRTVNCMDKKYSYKTNRWPKQSKWGVGGYTRYGTEETGSPVRKICIDCKKNEQYADKRCLNCIKELK